MYSRMISNLLFFYLILLNAEITNMCHHIQIIPLFLMVYQKIVVRESVCVCVCRCGCWGRISLYSLGWPETCYLSWLQTPGVPPCPPSFIFLIMLLILFITNIFSKLSTAHRTSRCQGYLLRDTAASKSQKRVSYTSIRSTNINKTRKQS